VDSPWVDGLQAASRVPAAAPKKTGPRGARFRLQRRRYLLVPELEPLEPLEPLLPEPLELGELELGEVLLPVAPPVAPLLEPDLLK
jgi:hypothetical protein